MGLLGLLGRGFGFVATPETPPAPTSALYSLTSDFRTGGTQAEILRQVVARLREKIAEFTESTCFVSDQEIPVSWPSGSICCTVSTGPAQYPPEFFTGGGRNQITKDSTLKVAVYVRSKLDHSPHTEAAIVGADKGIVSRFEPLILKTLLCDERDGLPVPWEPCNKDGSKILRNQLSPSGSTPPTPVPQGDFLGMTISFDLTFDWLL